jgi:hypothetical protein
MTNAQIYCTVAELAADLKLPGDEPRLVQRIREASQFLARRFGRFVPVSETRRFAGVSVETLNLGEGLLEITAVRVDGAAVTDYTARPASRCWPNGPYTWLERSAGWGQAVEIDGLWGLYQEAEPLGVSLTQAVDATTLALPDGSLLSPGMVLQLGAEQQLVTAGNGGERSPAATAAASKLAAAVDNQTAEIPVDDGAEFHAGEVLQIGTEDLAILKLAGNTLVCARGWNGTIAAAHDNDSSIGVYRTYTVTRAVNGTTAAAHQTVAASRLLPPADVHWLALQIAGLMRMKAISAFGGRAGNPNQGETFYINEFPRQIADIHQNYSIPYL